MRPIFAADRLKVLRRQNELFDIVLYEADLHRAHMPKDKRLDLIQGLSESELVQPVHTP
jgi:hypothetical protein